MGVVDNTYNFLLNCKPREKQASPSIYMVPSVLRDVSPSCYTPKVVSIGPLHRQDKNLQRFEVKKITYLYDLLERYDLEDDTLRNCVSKVVDTIKKIKECYAAESMPYNDFELAQMMVIDACFILEFVAKLSPSSSENNLRPIDRLIIYDMLLIENQIPFSVLEDIFDCTILASKRMVEGASLSTHMSVLVRHCYFFKRDFVVPYVSTDHIHILDLVHKYYQPLDAKPSSEPLGDIKGYSASELERAGMIFKPNRNPNWALAMTLKLPLPWLSWILIFMVIPPLSWFLWPTLRMPEVHINDHSELILRNLLTYEQLSNVKRYVTSYVYALNKLIDTPEDVALLVKSKVLEHYLGSDEELASMMNKLSRFMIVDEFHYGKQWKGMDAYYHSYWPNTIAGLKRTYFNNPWNIIALFAAFALFALTIVQTIFTVNPPS